MAASSSHEPLSPTIRRLLSSLKWRIRMYVWAEGFALALLWLALTFWAALALDYFPVLLGASEMPLAVRLALLVGVALVLAFILYRWVARRAFVRFADHSMAVLLERRFDSFHDSLVTSVEMAEQPDHAQEFNDQMLDHTSHEALAHTSDVHLGEVFNYRPLAWKMVVAVLLIVPMGIFYVVNAQAFEFWVNRFYLLKNDPWERNARIEVVGLEVVPPVDEADQEVSRRLLRFGESQIKVAKGTSLNLLVRADASKYLPDTCTVRYRTEDGPRGRVDMKKIGSPRDGYQNYTYDGKPFKIILGSLEFDVWGYDHRLRDFQIQVVENPAIVQTELDCEFPSYMVDEKLSLWLPRTLELTGNTQLPIGTQVRIRCRSNKTLERVEVQHVEASASELEGAGEEGSSDEGSSLASQEAEISEDRESFAYQLPSLSGNTTLEITLHDTDGVVTKDRIFIAGIEDLAPKVDVRLRGIGTAVTPEVVIPAEGTIQDDYGVARSWFKILVNDASPEEFPLQLAPGGKVESRLDFREQRQLGDEGLALTIGNKVMLTIQAADKYDLGESANVGVSDSYQLEVVSADQLLSLLERRELGLRRRFEQIIEEVTQMRDSLARVRSELQNDSDTTREPGEPGENETGDEEDKVDPEAEAARTRSLRLLRVQRGLLSGEKASQETLGVAMSFQDIREELINNRVDTEDRKKRLQKEIAEPLLLVAETMFPELDRLLKELEKNIDGQQSPQMAEQVVQQTDDILAEMDSILQKMLELETYNELIDLVRGLLTDQQKLRELTEAEKKKQALDLLKKP